MKQPLLILSLLLLPAIANAHTGIGPVSGLQEGFMHPLSGWDHIAAMLAVGIWGVQLSGNRVWLLPLVFVCVMAGSALLAMIGLPLAYTEIGIIASNFALALLIVSAVRLSAPVSILAVAFFAIFHGSAHGSEAPLNADGFGYIAGFASATVFLHLTGIAIGLLFKTLLGRINALNSVI